MSAKGSRPFARLITNGNPLYTDGVPLVIPFTSGISGAFVSSSFGSVVTIIGQFGGSPVFSCQFGIYLVQVQVAINTSPTNTTIVLRSASGNNADASEFSGGPGAANVTCTMNANRLSTEAPFPGAPSNFPTLIYCTFLAQGGGNGAIQSAGTKIFIEQLTTY